MGSSGAGWLAGWVSDENSRPSCGRRTGEFGGARTVYLGSNNNNNNNNNNTQLLLLLMRASPTDHSAVQC
jgi:hypothetical protein